MWKKIVFVPPAEADGIVSKINHSDCKTIRQMPQNEAFKIHNFHAHKMPREIDFSAFLRIKRFSLPKAHCLFVMPFAYDLNSWYDLYLHVASLFPSLKRTDHHLQI